MDILQMSTSSQDNESQGQEKEYQLVIFPKKFLNPLMTYRMQGDFHLYSDSKHMVFNERMKLGLSCQNPYKRVSKIVVDQQRVIISYTQLDFSVTPWQYVVKRLESLGNKEAYELCSHITKYYEELRNELCCCKQYEEKKKIQELEYRASGLYIYKYIKELDQFVISEVQYDLKLIQELGFNVQKFIQSCLKFGIPELSLKQGCSNEELFKNVIEFTKPLINPGDTQEYYLYSNLYPQGLRTNVHFSVENSVSKIDEQPLINFNIYYNYTPQLQYQTQQQQQEKTLSQKNCVSHYYDISENQFNRCGYKKVKL